MSSYSKAPRGLLVLLWEGRIFTAISISPGPFLIERSTRDAFRAGRNLPDKELRYLRTVIVTAAVHPGLGLVPDIISDRPLTYGHWAGVSPHTSPCGFSGDLCFC